MSIAPYLKEIGRGKDGARSLSEAQALDLMARLLDGQLSDLEVGAFVLAMRIKGESIAELAGFLRAVHSRCLAIEAPRPAVLLPSYNGARRLPNLTPLLAQCLARAGVPVLVHGPLHDAARVTSADIFAAMGQSPCADAGAVRRAWQRGDAAFIDVGVLCPALAKLLAVRQVVGLRNSGHTLAKLLAPVGGALALRVVNYTHPEYAELLAQFMSHDAGSAMLLRGTEGEPVADARRTPRMDVYVGGVARAELGVPATPGSLTSVPQWPTGRDADSTAAYIADVLKGRAPLPASIAAQVDSLVKTLAALPAA